MRFLSVFICCFFRIVGFFLPALHSSAQTISFPDILPESSVMMQVGEELWCLSDRAWSYLCTKLRHVIAF